MTMEISPTRYAHCNGHTDVCYSSDGKYILTCGTDSDVRKWCGIEDDDPQAVGTKNMNAIAVVSNDDKFFVSGDDNKVQIFSLSEMTHQGILSKATASITCLSLSKNGKTLASGGCDFVIHVTEIESFKDSTLTGHSAPVLSVAFDPAGEFLASSSCDGSFRVWELGSSRQAKTWPDSFPASNDFHDSKTLARMSWEPKHGKLLAVPFGDSIKLFQRGSWNESLTLKDPAISKPFSIVSYSPCGKLLVATSGDGFWSMFDVVAGYKLVASEQNPRGIPVTGLAWKPRDSVSRSLAFSNFEGDLGTVSFTLPDMEPEESGDIIEAVEKEMEDDDDFTSDIDMDDLDRKMRPESRMSAGTVEGSVMTGQIAAVPRAEVAFVMQEAFQPSACPVHLQRRFMVYNNVGIVIAISDEGDSSTIDVEFHNISVHHNMSMPNLYEHTVCALSEEVLALSGPRHDSADASRVAVQLLQGSDAAREWSVQLPAGEETVALAAGLGFVAAATNEGCVRLFTTAGVQRDVITVGGHIVSMAAQGKQLMVVYLTGLGSKKFQSYGCVVFSVRDNSIRFSKRHQHLPVPTGCTLRWIGFTDEGNPCTYDSEGKIHVVAPNGITYMLADTERTGEKSPTSHYFLVGVNETEMKFRAILCKGAFYPPITPRPIMAEILIQAPVCEPGSAKGKLEEEFMRTKRAAYSSKSICPTTGMPKDDDYAVISNVKSFNTTLLKLFAMACVADLDTKAFDIYKLMTANEWKTKARQYAHSKNKNRLLEKLEEFVEPIESDEETEIIEESQEIDSRYRMLSRHNSMESFGRSEPTVEPIKVSKLKRVNSLQRSFEMFSSPSQAGGNPFKKNAPKPPLSETLLSKNSYVDTPDELRSPTPDSMQPDASNLSSKHMSDFSEASQDTNGVAPEEPVEEPVAKTNGFTLDGFKTWFENNKSSLESEFPGLKTAELKKEGIKKYKASIKPVGKKRGAPAKQDAAPQPKKPAYKKLDAFLFKKKPVEVEPVLEDKDENTQFDSAEVVESSDPLPTEETLQI